MHGWRSVSDSGEEGLEDIGNPGVGKVPVQYLSNPWGNVGHRYSLLPPVGKSVFPSFSNFYTALKIFVVIRKL